MLLESAFHNLFCVKFSFKLVTFSKSYARKQKWVFFFLNTVFSNENELGTPGQRKVIQLTSIKVNY